MKLTPEGRAKAVKVIADRLMEVAPGHTRQEAEEVAEAMIDQAEQGRNDDAHD